MQSRNEKTKALLKALDSMIHQHGPNDPLLLKDLLAHRAALEDALRTNQSAEIAKAMLRVATWVKFIYDLL